jgi:hypothetical protein
MRDRSFRRRQQAKALRKARTLFPDSTNWQRFAGLSTPCSCWMCGHRRRWEGPPIQERRSAPPRSGTAGPPPRELRDAVPDTDRISCFAGDRDGKSADRPLTAQMNPGLAVPRFGNIDG